MPGIWGIVSEKPLASEIDLSNAFHREKSTTYIIDSKNYLNCALGRCSIDKFQKDKMFEEISGSLICIDGVILNLKRLQNSRAFQDLSRYLLEAYNQNRYNFAKDLRGNFAGFLYLINDNEIVIFNDHIGSKPIYYYYNNIINILIFSSELKVVIEGIRQLGFLPHLDLRGAYCILTFGFMLGDLTLVSEIKKIPPGSTLIFDGEKINIERYYQLHNTPHIEDDESKIIEELDRRFQDAIELEYEKDLDCGYNHLATLSGGLDSRTNVAYAKKLGFSKITCFTFSQSGYLDEEIAAHICSDNNFEHIFFALDNGDYLVKYIDDVISSNDGLVLYSGAAHSYACARVLSFNDYGLVHTGQIGDLVLGSYLDNAYDNGSINNSLKKIAYSTKLLYKLEHIMDINNLPYGNGELLAFYERCVNGVFNGYRMFEQFSEFSSPFLYLEFLEYAIKIKPKYRYNEKIYPKWIKESIPKFSKYKWEKYGIAPRYPIIFMKCFKRLRNLSRRILFGKSNSMNPMELWWKSNERLRIQFQAIFDNNIQNTELYPELLNDCRYLFKHGTFLEKTQVLTILLAIKLHGIGRN
ncbi:MAG: asparagine synthase-related protein [Methanotrichaceae archaeon]|nr:asparagine synthase-related protein [Methanotrichaceae archaeon]